jgi:hypothetical protein
MKQKDSDDDSKPRNKYRHVYIKGINFKPDPKLLEQMNREATFERAERDVMVPCKTSDSRDERISKALDVIDRQGYMTLADYASVTSQSRSMASKDLRQLASDPTTGITTRGSHSHKVWIRRTNDDKLSE